MRTRTYRTLPAIVTGYELADEFSIVVPEATTNLIANPSFERATTGYTAYDSGIARSTFRQRRGAYSLLVTPDTSTDLGGVSYQVAVTEDVDYAWSLDIYGQAGVEYQMIVIDASASLEGIEEGMWIGYNSTLTYSFDDVATSGVSATKTFRGNDCWQRQTLLFTADATENKRLYLVKSDARHVGAFYTDGWQLEAKNYATTYADGDMRGYIQDEAAYQWTGTAHASTSIRAASTRSGGRVISLKDIGFHLSGFTGLGLGIVSNLTSPLSLGGQSYETTLEETRQIVITGMWQEKSRLMLERRKGDIYDLVRWTQTARRQPFRLHYMPADGCENLLCQPLEMRALYEDGLEGTVNNYHGEAPQITLSAYDPTIYSGGDGGESLGYNFIVANTNGIIGRDPEGVWFNLAQGVNGNIRAIVEGLNGMIYVFGDFTTAQGGTVLASRAAVYNPESNTWSALGSGLNGIATGASLSADGKIYVTGAFTTAGGGAANRIAYWDTVTSTWSALGSGLDNSGGAVVVAPTGLVYVTGSFTTAGGGAALRAAVWNPGSSSWSALGAGLNNTGLAVIAGPDGNIYFGGAFTLAGGAGALRVARWNVTLLAWEALGQGPNNTVSTLDFGPDGYLYLGGAFTSADSTSANRVARWNGAGYEALGSGLNAPAEEIAFDAQGTLYAAGSSITSAGGITTTYIARWNGTTWLPSDVFLPNTTITVFDIFQSRTGYLYIGFAGSGDSFTTEVTEVENTGTADTLLRVEFIGPGRIVQFGNWTTGAMVYTDYTLGTGERAVLLMTREGTSFVSDWRGDILGEVLRGSDISTLSLMPGTNSLVAYMTGTANGVTGVVASWPIAYLAASDAVR